jgi:hypothetical protein
MFPDLRRIASSGNPGGIATLRATLRARVRVRTGLKRRAGGFPEEKNRPLQPARLQYLTAGQPCSDADLAIFATISTAPGDGRT